jgi:mannose-1-phosphate guanylyltransferase
MVLSAGCGTRLGPLPDELPKALLPFGDRSLLEHVLDALGSQGFLPAAVNAHHLAASIRRTVAGLGGKAMVIDEPEIRGTAGGVRGALGLIAPGAVVVTNADVLASVDFGALKRRAPRGGLCLAVVPRPRGTGTVGLGVGGRVVRLRGERFGEELAGGDYVGAMAIGEGLRERLPARGCLIGDVALPIARAGGELQTEPAGPELTEPGDSLEAYLRENLAWLRARGEGAYVGPDARVSGGVELEGAVIGAGARVEGEGRLERVVVWPGARVRAPLSNVVATTAGRVVAVAPP